MNKHTSFFKRLEEELFEEYNEKISCCDEESEKCMYCGFSILKGEGKARVGLTGDVIHKKCWNDYAEDYFDELCETIDDIFEEE